MAISKTIKVKERFPSQKKWDDMAVSWLMEKFPTAKDIVIKKAHFHDELFHVIAYIDWKEKVDFTVNSTALLFHIIKKYL